MAARPGSVPVTLVLGEEELLAERAVADAVAVARERLGPGTAVEEVRAGGLPDGFAMGLATASLFGGWRASRRPTGLTRPPGRRCWPWPPTRPQPRRWCCGRSLPGGRGSSSRTCSATAPPCWSPG